MSAAPTLSKKSLIGGFFFVAILGTLAHFFYEWSGQNPVCGLFFPISESTWEHMKLVFFPMLLWIGLFFPAAHEKSPGLIFLALLANLLGTALIPILFYSYSGILGFNIPAVDISIFYISVLFIFLFIWKKRKLSFENEKMANALIVALTILFTVSFFVFTYFVPDFGIFHNPAQPYSA